MSIYEFFEKNSLYIVLTIALVVWLFIFGYLLLIDAKLRKLENEISNKENKKEEL